MFPSFIMNLYKFDNEVFVKIINASPDVPKMYIQIWQTFLDCLFQRLNLLFILHLSRINDSCYSFITNLYRNARNVPKMYIQIWEILKLFVSTTCFLHLSRIYMLIRSVILCVCLKIYKIHMQDIQKCSEDVHPNLTNIFKLLISTTCFPHLSRIYIDLRTRSYW